MSECCGRLPAVDVADGPLGGNRCASASASASASAGRPMVSLIHESSVYKYCTLCDRLNHAVATMVVERRSQSACHEIKTKCQCDGKVIPHYKLTRDRTPLLHDMYIFIAPSLHRFCLLWGLRYTLVNYWCMRCSAGMNETPHTFCGTVQCTCTPIRAYCTRTGTCTFESLLCTTSTVVVVLRTPFRVGFLVPRLVRVS